MNDFVDKAGIESSPASAPPCAPARPVSGALVVAPPRTLKWRWSWKLVTVAGIEIYIHGVFLILLASLAHGDRAAAHDAEEIAEAGALR